MFPKTWQYRGCGKCWVGNYTNQDPTWSSQVGSPVPLLVAMPSAAASSKASGCFHGSRFEELWWDLRRLWGPAAEACHKMRVRRAIPKGRAVLHSAASGQGPIQLRQLNGMSGVPVAGGEVFASSCYLPRNRRQSLSWTAWRKSWTST